MFDVDVVRVDVITHVLVEKLASHVELHVLNVNITVQTHQVMIFERLHPMIKNFIGI